MEKMKKTMFFILLIGVFCSIESVTKKVMVKKTVQKPKQACNYYKFKSPNGKKMYYIKECNLK